MSRRLAVIACAVLVACAEPVAKNPSASPVSPTIAPTARTTATAIPPAGPKITRGTDPVAPLGSRSEYGDLPITVDIPDRLGQPAEDIVWTVTPFTPDSGYAARVASALGMSGPGTLGSVPPGAGRIGAGPWRLWFGPRVLAVNEGSGEVLYFDPSANDGPQPPGPARRDSAEMFRQLLGKFGWNAELSRKPRFVGTEIAARAEQIVHGQWLGPGYRETAILFPQYALPGGQGVSLYDSDHVALLTSQGRPAEIVHRPLGTIVAGAIYPITTFGQAAAEVRAAPHGFLRYLSNPTGEPLTLRFTDAYLGSAWTAGSASRLTRAGRMLAPVWIFATTGTSASGLPVDALFVVDAVAPEHRLRGSAAGAGVVDADYVLSEQLATLGGESKDLLTPRGALNRYYPPTPECEPDMRMPDGDTATGSMKCGTGPTISFTLRRAFPGLAASIWYVSELRR